MIGIFLIKVTQFEKTLSIGKDFVSLENLQIKFYFRNYKKFAFLWAISTFVFGDCTLLNFQQMNLN